MDTVLLSAAAELGGTEIHTLGLANTLARRGHAVTLLCLARDVFAKAPLPAHPAVKVSCLGLRGPLRSVRFLTWVRAFRRHGADVAVFPKGYLRDGSLALDLAARWCYRRFLTIEHGTAPPSEPRVSRAHLGGLVPGVGLWWFRQRLSDFSRSLAPRQVVCVSDAVRKRLVETYHFAPHKLLTVRNGIDPERFRPDARLRKRTRSQWGIPEECPVLGLVGRLSREKGCDVAIEVFRRLAQDPTLGTCRLVIVGDGPMTGEVRAAVTQSGLQDRVLFAGRTERPWEVYPAVDVLLLPSRVEGLPLGLLEAMACGCCAVAMGVGGVPEVLTDPALGELVPPGDVSAFVAAVRAALQAGTEARAIHGQRARAHVQAHFRAGVQFAALAAVVERARGADILRSEKDVKRPFCEQGAP
jgi:glycosyltransferase involved in cell wall biosynthesis